MTSKVSSMPKRYRNRLPAPPPYTRRNRHLLTVEEHIRRLDLFAMDDERRLEGDRARLFQAAMTAAAAGTHWSPHDTSSREPVLTEDDQMDLYPLESQAGGAASALSSGGSHEGRRASKRRATQWEGYEVTNQGDQESATKDSTQPLAFFNMNQAVTPRLHMQPQVMYPATPNDGSSASMPGVYLDPAAAQLVFQALNIMCGQSSGVGGGNQAGLWFNNAMQPSTPGRFDATAPHLLGSAHVVPVSTPDRFSTPTPGPSSRLGHPPAIDQKSSAQPFGGDSHSMSSHRPPALTSASSVATSSSESNSYGPTLFTDPMSQSNPRSFMSSADVPRYPLSQSACNAPPSTTSEPVRPMVSTETPNQELRTPRTNKPYELDELDAIIRFFLGKDVPAGRLEVAMRTRKSPRPEHILESEWSELSTDKVFKGKRSPRRLAAQWWTLVDTYHDILGFLALTDSGSDDNSVPTLINQLRTLTTGGSALGKLRPDAVDSWINDSENGWFALMHTKFKARAEQHAQNPSSQAQTPAFSRATSSRRGGRSVQSESSAPPCLAPSFAATTSHPLSAASSNVESAPPPSHSSWVRPEADAPGTPAPSVARALPGVLEVVRETHAFNNASMELTASRAFYMRCQGVALRVENLERLWELKSKQGSSSSSAIQLALDIIEGTGASPELRGQAEATIAQELARPPPPGDIEAFLARLEALEEKNSSVRATST